MIRGVDLFCGAGGTTTGLLSACGELALPVELLAINHWNVAIDSHTRNHPSVRHLCESLDGMDPRKVIPGGKLNILCASPECTHHSIARGGKPCSDQSRATAWHICRWAEALRIENILIENVREFRNWGPLTKKGQPMKSRKGHTYLAFLNALRSLGYVVEDRVINCADYGDPTTRQRLFILARRGRPVVWPAASHAGNWQPARGIIDWSLKGKSIFTRERPLSANTIRRIQAGLRKFGGEAFLVKFHGNRPGAENGTNRVYSPDVPLPTVDTQNRFGLAEPFVMAFDHTGANGNYVNSVEAPLSCITSKQRHCLVEPFLVQFYGTNDARSIDRPMPTVTSQGNHTALCEPFVIGQQSCAAARKVSDPLPTIAGAGAIALVEPFLVKYYGTGESHSVSEPLPTVTGTDRFGLVEPTQPSTRHPQPQKMDINFRMLQPHELSAAMSFPKGYQFAGTRGCQVKQIGNAVPVRTAAALCKALLT